MPGSTAIPGCPDSIDWPAVIKFEGDDELLYVGSGQEWASDANLHACRYSQDDCLVDSSGHKFRLVAAADGVVMPADSGEMISLQSFIRLLRAHAAAAGQCCIEKIMTRSVAEGIALVRSLGDA